MYGREGDDTIVDILVVVVGMVMCNVKCIPRPTTSDNDMVDKMYRPQMEYGNGEEGTYIFITNVMLTSKCDDLGGKIWRILQNNIVNATDLKSYVYIKLSILKISCRIVLFIPIYQSAIK